MKRRGRAAAAVAPAAAAPADAKYLEQLAETRRYFIWLLIGIFFEYARPASFIPGLHVIKPYSMIPVLLTLAVSFSKNPTLRPFKDILADGIIRWLGFYVFLIMFSVLHADVQTKAFEMFTVAVGYMLYFYLITRIVVTRERMLGVFAVLLLAHLWLLALNPQFVLDPTQRSYVVGATFLGDTNDYTLSLCILMPMVIELAVSTRKTLLKLLYWGAVLVLGLAIVASQSRGAALGIAAVLIYLWLISPRKALTLVGFTVLATIMLLYASDQFFDRMSTISNYQEEGSAMGRITAWKAGVQMMLDNPILGVGAGHFAISFGTHYIPPEEIGPYPWLTAHSIYFLILGELSIPGIITLLMLIFGNMLSSFRIRRAVLQLPPEKLTQDHLLGARMLYMLNGSMVGFAVAGAFLSAAYYPHIYLLTALMIVQRRDLINSLGIDPKGRMPRRPRRNNGTPAVSTASVVPAQPKSSGGGT